MSSLKGQKMGEETASVKSVQGTSNAEVIVIDHEEENRVLRKIDRVILPLMCVVFFFQYLDKQAIGFAAVFGLQNDLHMGATDYSWAISLFYFGQFAAEIIFIYVMSRLPVTRTVGIAIVIWGIVAGCLAAPTGFAAFGAVRFLLGFCEGAVSPAFVLITATWYKRSEHPIRIAAWISCNGVAQIIGALLMYGIGLAKNTALTNWRVMFLVCGGGTIAAGIAFILLMPHGPETAWFLTEAERVVAVQRLAVDRLNKEASTFKRSQMFEAFLDPKVYVFCLFAFFGTMAGPVLKFSSLIISGFGFSKFNTMLVGLPGGFLQILLIWVVAIGTRVTKTPRSWWGVFVCLIPLVGNIGILTLPAENKWGIVVFTWLAGVISPVLMLSLSLIASNIKGNTKKSTVSNMFFVTYAIAAIAAPQLWLTSEAPRFRKGLITNMVSFGGLITLFVLWDLMARFENNRRDATHRLDDEIVAPDDSDITDKEDLAFRYTA